MPGREPRGDGKGTRGHDKAKRVVPGVPSEHIITEAPRLIGQRLWRAQVARALRIHPSTFRGWCAKGEREDLPKDDPHIRLAEGVLQAEAELLKGGISGAIDEDNGNQWYLERRFPRYFHVQVKREVMRAIDELLGAAHEVLGEEQMQKVLDALEESGDWAGFIPD